MASRAAAGARPGARFAQFKLVLLGWFPPVIGPTIVCVKSTDMLFSFALSRRVRSRKGWDFVIFRVLNSGR